MPVIPSKEDAAKIFGGGSDDNSSSTPNEGGAGEQGDKAKASAQDLMNKGPVQTDGMSPATPSNPLFLGVVQKLAFF